MIKPIVLTNDHHPCRPCQCDYTILLFALLANFLGWPSACLIPCNFIGYRCVRAKFVIQDIQYFLSFARATTGTTAEDLQLTEGCPIAPVKTFPNKRLGHPLRWITRIKSVSPHPHGHP